MDCANQLQLGKSAGASLRSELREPLTGMILDGEVALDAPLSPDVKEKIGAAKASARQLQSCSWMRRKLRRAILNNGNANPTSSFTLCEGLLLPLASH